MLLFFAGSYFFKSNVLPVCSFLITFKSKWFILLSIPISLSLNKECWFPQKNWSILLWTNEAGTMKFWITWDPLLPSNNVCVPYTLAPKGTEEPNASPYIVSDLGSSKRGSTFVISSFAKWSIACHTPCFPFWDWQKMGSWALKNICWTY